MSGASPGKTPAVLGTFPGFWEFWFSEQLFLEQAMRPAPKEVPTSETQAVVLLMYTYLV